MRLGESMTSGAGRRLVAVSRFSFVGMALPEFGIGRVTTPTSLPRSFVAYAGVLRARGHCRRLAADDPEESEKGDYANSDREKINVFSIHKTEADCCASGESPSERNLAKRIWGVKKDEFCSRTRGARAAELHFNDLSCISSFVLIAGIRRCDREPDG